MGQVYPAWSWPGRDTSLQSGSRYLLTALITSPRWHNSTVAHQSFIPSCHCIDVLLQQEKIRIKTSVKSSCLREFYHLKLWFYWLFLFDTAPNIRGWVCFCDASQQLYLWKKWGFACFIHYSIVLLDGEYWNINLSSVSYRSVSKLYWILVVINFKIIQKKKKAWFQDLGQDGRCRAFFLWEILDWQP